MDIQDFMKTAEELTEQRKQKIIGQPLKKKLKLKNTLKAKHSPYREEIETKILPTIYELFPFNERPDSLGSTVLKESLYFYSKYEESASRDMIQTTYLKNLKQNLNFSKKTIYENIEKILNEKLEELKLNKSSKMNETHLQVNEKYLLNIKLLKNQFELKKIKSDQIRWFNSKLKMNHVIKYEVKDFIYSSQQAKDSTIRNLFLEYSSMELKK